MEKMSTLAVPGAVINYEFWGEGNNGWVTLINGHTRPLNDFRMLGKKLVESGFKVLAFDNRGAGNTTIARDFTLVDMCADVRALWTALGVVKSHLLGISMGGFICQQLLQDSGEKVKSLVLVSTAAKHGGIASDERPWTTDVHEVMLKLSTFFTPQFAQRNEVLVRSMAKQIAAQVVAGQFVINSQRQRKALEGFDLTANLPDIQVPALIIHGEEDAIVPLAEGETLAAGIPGAEIIRIKEAGHLLLAEAPAQLYAAVLNFFKA